MPDVIDVLERENRPQFEIVRKCVLFPVRRAVERGWNSAEEHEIKKTLIEAGEIIGKTAWRDGWKPIFNEVTLIEESCHYNTLIATGVTAILKRSSTHKQRVYGLVSLCRDLARENAELKATGWYKLWKFFSRKVW
jgi:hypothetical protein